MCKKNLFFIFSLFLLIIGCSSSVINFKINPTSHDFGQVNISETATFDFVVTNKKSVDMTLTIVSFSTGEFSETTGAQGKTIIAKGTLTITAQFAPALPGGAKTDTMHIEWTDINGKTGKKDVKLSGEAVPVPKINVPSTFDFGTVGIGQTPTHDFDIENTGTADLVLSLLNFNGNSTLYSVTVGGLTPITINPGATHTITVQFAPIATGNFPTVLEITHNAVNATPPAEITISAAGGGGRIVLNQTSPWDFGTIKTGGSATDVVEISNTGSIDLNITCADCLLGVAFSVVKIEDSSGNPISAPFAISPADHVEVTIQFSPATTGNFNDSLNITHDGSYSVSPASLNLEGVGRAPITQTFNYSGRAQNWNVPAGITMIKAECWGAEGTSIGRGIGGKGGKATATIPVSPGSPINVYVGGKSSNRYGGWNGGGNGYTNGAGGGGASDIRIGGTALSDRKIVGGAGGGGGAYSSYSGIVGGSGGGLVGGGGATGGTQTAGGAAGCGNGATPGRLGIGGNGRNNVASSSGGGGGYYGGGGNGASYGGGGGGSSYYDASGNTAKSTQSGIRSGNGLITIEY